MSAVAVGLVTYFLICAVGMGLDLGHVLSDKRFPDKAIWAWCVGAALIAAVVFVALS